MRDVRKFTQGCYTLELIAKSNNIILCLYRLQKAVYLTGNKTSTVTRLFSIQTQKSKTNNIQQQH